MTLRVAVQRVSGHPGSPDAVRARRWARAAWAAAHGDGAGEAGDAELCLRLVDAEEGAALNGTFRGKQGATNVLTFPFDAQRHTDPPLLGDVVVCAPVVAREAREQGKTLDAHFAHMVVHGVLHLLGYDHRRDADAAAMEALERSVLAGLGYPDPYESRRSADP